jgi:hypothetical protein
VFSVIDPALATQQHIGRPAQPRAPAKMPKNGGNVPLLDEPINDLNTER